LVFTGSVVIASWVGVAIISKLEDVSKVRPAPVAFKV
jgi:hypothetical protein